jgi:putative hydrolase of the HAD superfamily
MLPRAILFDLDETILQVAGGAEAAWRAVATEFSAELGPLSPAELADAVVAFSRIFWEDAGRHRHWRMRLAEARREVVSQVLGQLAAAGRPVPPADVAMRIADRFSAYRDEQLCLFPDAHAVIDAFKARGVLLALITNGAAELQRAKIVRFELTHRFDHIQIEGEHEFGKPDEQAYRHALKTLGVEARDTWMVGDNLEWEVVAPQRLGIHAIWFDGTGKGLPEGTTVKPDRIIRRLTELLPDDCRR